MSAILALVCHSHESGNLGLKILDSRFRGNDSLETFMR